MDYICLVTAELMIAVAAVVGCCFSMEEEIEEVEVVLLVEVKVQRGA